MALSDDVAGIAQNTNQMTNQGGNDALQAYHIAATAEHARQELEMEKASHQMNKANWLVSQLDAIAKMPEATQNIAMKSFPKQAAQAGIMMDPNFADAMHKDRELRTNAFIHSAHLMSAGGIQSPEDAKTVLDTYGGDFSSASSEVQKLGQGILQMKGNQLKADAMGARAATMQDNAVIGAVQKVHTNPAMTPVKKQALNIDKELGVLEPVADSQGNLHQPTWTDLNEYKQGYTAALNGQGISSDFKLKELGDPSYKQKLAELEAKAKGNQDQPADPTAVDFWKARGQRLQKQLDNQLGVLAHAGIQGLSPEFLHNPNVVPAVRQAAQKYMDGTWRQDPMARSGLEEKQTVPAPSSSSLNFEHMTDDELSSAYKKLKGTK